MMTKTFYGTEVETFYVDSQKGVWIVESVDFRPGQKFERIDSLPEECLIGQTHLPSELLDESLYEAADLIEDSLS